MEDRIAACDTTINGKVFKKGDKLPFEYYSKPCAKVVPTVVTQKEVIKETIKVVEPVKKKLK